MGLLNSAQAEIRMSGRPVVIESLGYKEERIIYVITNRASREHVRGA